MSIRAVVSRIASLFRRRQQDADLDDEIRAHLDLLAAEYERRGMTPGQARFAARREFGGVQQMKETYRIAPACGGSKTHDATPITRCARCAGRRCLPEQPCSRWPSA
jgi:hypothetical protein